MAPKKHSDIDRDGNKLMWPLMLILVGIIVLLVNLGLLTRDWIAYWPIILIVVGLMKFMQNN